MIYQCAEVSTQKGKCGFTRTHLDFFVFAFLMLVWINYTVGVTRTENGGCLARQLSNGNRQGGIFVGFC